MTRDREVPLIIHHGLVTLLQGAHDGRSFKVDQVDQSVRRPCQNERLVGAANVLDRLDDIVVILLLLENETELSVRNEQIIVSRDRKLVDFRVTVVSCTSAFLLAFFALDGELSPRVSLLVIRDVHRDHFLNLLDYRSDVLNTYLPGFITLDEQKLASSLVVVGVNRCNCSGFVESLTAKFGD